MYEIKNSQKALFLEENKSGYTMYSDKKTIYA